MILDTEYTVGGVRFRYNQEKSQINSSRKDRGYDHRIVAECLLSALDSMDNSGYPGQVLEFTYIEGVMFTVATDDGYDELGEYFGIYTYWKTEKIIEKRVLANGGF